MPKKPKRNLSPKEEKIKIDLEGIQRRVMEFPTREGRFGRVLGCTEKKIFYSLYPIEGKLNGGSHDDEPSANGVLLYYDLEEQKEETFVNWVSDFQVSRDGKFVAVRSGNRLRVLKASQKPNNEGGDAPGRKSGWIDLHRLRVPVIPGVEWTQMFNEAWRLQRDQYWTPDMAQIDWLGIRSRYLPLVERVASRSEFSDLVWELQGELGTSHSYEFGGDYRPGPHYSVGLLGADFAFDEQSGGWKVLHIARGDTWEEKSAAPFERLGVDIVEGDVLLAINGLQLSRTLPPQAVLIGLANNEVALTFTARAEGDKRSFLVKPLASESSLRYREWVERNRAAVHQATSGQVGYLHIPDMSARGYAEFHRGYLAEVDYPGLIVDLRFNGGGNVSALLLEKLARKRLGYDVTRWGELPGPYPAEFGHGTDRGPDQRARRLGRRHLLARLQINGARPADRQAHLGRCHRHLAAPHPGRRHGHHPTRVFDLFQRRALGGRKLRHRSRYRGRQHPARLRPRGRCPARALDRRDSAPAGSQPTHLPRFRLPPQPLRAQAARPQLKIKVLSGYFDGFTVKIT